MGSNADGIIHCGCGERHWGHAGAAGVLAWRGTGSRDVIMQLRAGWSMSGGTWGIPGGAIAYDELPIEGGLREAEEEAGLEPSRVWASTTLHHPNWSYTTAVAEAQAGQRALATDHESDAMEWVPWDQLTERNLMPAFAQTLPLLNELLGTYAMVIDPALLADGWEETLPLAVTAGFPASFLPEATADLIAQGIAASTDGFERTVSWYPDIILLGTGRTMSTVPVVGAQPAQITWAMTPDTSAYDTVVTLSSSDQASTLSSFNTYLSHITST